MKTKKDIAAGSAPLHCWDIYMYAYQRRMQLSADLTMFKNIQAQYKWSTTPVSPGYALLWLNRVVIITNPDLQVIYATENIYTLTGYKPGEVIGNRPSIFQGRDTTPESRNIIRTAVDRKLPFETVITNYKKDGTRYECHVDGYPIFNKDGNLVNFMALENKVA